MIYVTKAFAIKDVLLEPVQRYVAMSGQKERMIYATLREIIVTKVSNV